MSDDQILKTPEKGKGTLESPVIQNVENEIQTPPMVVRYNFLYRIPRLIHFPILADRPEISRTFWMYIESLRQAVSLLA